MKTGVKVVDHGWDAIVKAVKAAKAQNSYVKVGILGDDPKSTRAEGTLSNVEIGAVHEFGSPAANIPERSFLRSTVDAHKEAYNQHIEDAARDVVHGKYTVEQTLNRLGARAAADVKATIRKGIPPPLQPETVARKGSTKPLVDTGQLISSITWKITSTDKE